MNHAARRIGRSLALVLPVVLVLSGTLAVTRVPWATSPSDSQVLTASAEKASTQAKSRAPQDVLRDRLVAELQEENPSAALTSLQKEMSRKPSLAKHCASIARALGRAAVKKYGAAHRAHRYSRPVCDTSFAYGVAQMN
ncbi:membrane protein [Streptomyces albiaxialis]|uniref:Membrane protein n=1 Tax=Streptomyces albiaxialis TaxID=329523 RepID=A0ABN2VHJ2_9ACTN